jgi:hypothetical protein
MGAMTDERHPARGSKALVLPFRFFRRLIYVGILVGLLTLNVATLVSGMVFNWLSGLVEFVDVSSVREKHKAELSQKDRTIAQQRADLDTRDRTIVEQRAELDAKDRKLAQQSDELASLSSRNVDLTSQNARLRADLEIDYRGERVLYREAVSDTMDRVGPRMVHMTQRNIASIPGEALPFIGIAVVVAATTWELRDACKTMEDLHELDVALNPDRAIESGEVCGMRVPTAAEVRDKVFASPSVVWEEMKAQYDDLPDVSISRAYERILEWGRSLLTGWDDWSLFGESSPT